MTLLQNTPLYILGNEGALKVCEKPPLRRWVNFSNYEKGAQTEEQVFLGGHSFLAKGRVLKDGSYIDALSGKRTMFYCRILPDDQREELYRQDGEIDKQERLLALLRRERQEFLAACARRGKHVPMPPRTAKTIDDVKKDLST